MQDLAISDISQKNLGMELVRATEAAALACGRFMGRGDKEEAHRSAAAAMAQALGTVTMDAEVRVAVGAGGADDDPLSQGRRFGHGQGPGVDLAAGPIDGISLLTRGLPGAISVIAATERDRMLVPGSAYLEKIAVGRAPGARSTSPTPSRTTCAASRSPRT